MAQEERDDIQGSRDEAPYPVQYSVDYPESSNRLTVLFRMILAIPIIVLASAVQGAVGQYVSELAFLGGGLLFVPPLLMILFRQKYPRWWFDWNLEMSRFSARVGAYFYLLRDEYPSTDEEQGVHLDIEYPDAKNDLNRWLPLIKWLLAIPHFIILFFLAIAFMVVAITAWFAILITGKYPRGLFNFVVGYGRWATRVFAYSYLLTTDKYPPFRFGP
jgi:hypothetical protein